MARPRPALRLLLAHCLVLAALAQTAVYLVDVPDVVCPGGAGRVTIRLWPTSNSSDVAGTPHILTFFRTALTTTNVTFRLVAASNPSQEAIGNMTVNLQDVRSMRRRLMSDEQQEGRKQEEEAMNCEEFFLLDGRDPVEVPDTWEEAREAFRGICEEGGAANCSAAEAKIFAGYPDSEDPMDADDRLCLRLLAHASKLDSDGWLSYRRLKGSYSSRSGTSFSGRVVTSRPTVYGYSNDLLSSNYPRGYASSSYGYTGRAAIPLVFVMPYGYGTFIGSRYRTKCYDGSGQRCSSGQVACSGGTSCNLSLPSGEQQARDDLTDLGFVPSDYGNALDLIITAVVGSAYAPSRICGDVASGWIPPTGQDLYVALTPMAALFEDDDDEDPPPEVWVPPVVAAVLFLFCAPLCLICGLNCWQQRQLRKEFNGMAVRRRTEAADNRHWGIPQIWELKGQLHVAAIDVLPPLLKCEASMDVLPPCLKGKDRTYEVLLSMKVEEGGSFEGTLIQEGAIDWSLEGRLWMPKRNSYQTGRVYLRATKESDDSKQEVIEAAGMIDIMSGDHLGGLDRVTMDTMHGFGGKDGMPKKFTRGSFYLYASKYRDEKPPGPVYYEPGSDEPKLVLRANADLPGAVYEEPTPVVIGMPLPNLGPNEAHVFPQPAVVKPLQNSAGQKLEKAQASESFLEDSAIPGEEEFAEENDQGATYSAGAAGMYEPYEVFQDGDEQEADKEGPAEDNEATLEEDLAMSEHGDSGIAGLLKEGQELLGGEADAEVGGADDAEAPRDTE